MMERAILCVFLSCLAFLSPSRADGGSETCQVSKEKQLLEEMIRTQLKAEAMLQEIRKTEEHVISVLEYRKQDVQKSLEDLREDQANQKIEIDNLKTENAYLQEKIQALQESTNPVPVVFFVARGTNSSNIKNGQTLVFPVILNNKGSAFNNETGVFTAPVSGLVFNSSVTFVYFGSGQYVGSTFVFRKFDVYYENALGTDGRQYLTILAALSVETCSSSKRGK
ncbi:uncharacterized protein LOC132733477 [Ruditapes philippinarum]|uniref:uncharacterized protein LOC132733477 n=1 Tax=Ruditapes philippinarum TaxID=129788 RepID=UPI00295B4E97|nr:uncharacterized protein LOC132733477 [Ruditapes philippinarum]